MKKLIFAFITLLAMVSFAQTTTIVTPSGKNIVYSYSFTGDSLAVAYSSPIDVNGFLAQDIYTNPISVYFAATGTNDSLNIFVQSRMKTASGTYTTWTTVDTVVANTENHDGIARAYSCNLNGGHPDQIRILCDGLATNREDVVAKTIVVLTKQYAIFKIQ